MVRDFAIPPDNRLQRMKTGPFIVRLVAAWILGGAATVLLFFGVAWATRQSSLGIHSNAAFVLFLFPVALVAAFRLLARAGFPPSADAESR